MPRIAANNPLSFTLIASPWLREPLSTLLASTGAGNPSLWPRPHRQHASSPTLRLRPRPRLSRICALPDTKADVTRAIIGRELATRVADSVVDIYVCVCVVPVCVDSRMLRRAESFHE